MADATYHRQLWWWRRRRRQWSAAFQLLALIVLVAGVNCYEEHHQPGKSPLSLKEICSNAQVPITSVGEFKGLLDKLHHDERFEICPNRYREAFLQLEPILFNDDLVCSDAKFELIRDYHFKFINPRQETYKFGDDLNNLNKKIVPRQLDEKPAEYQVQVDERLHEVRCPIAVQQFFKAYALQVSGLCKLSLIENIEQAQHSLNEGDLELFQIIRFRPGADQKTPIESRLKNKDDSLANLMNTPRNYKYTLEFRDLVYMPELEGELEEGDTERRKEIVRLDLRDKPELNRFMKACGRRFRPVYSKLIMPIVRMAKLGYDYVGRELYRYGNKLNTDEVNIWRVVTLICESHGNIEPVEDEQDVDGDEDDEERIKPLAFTPTKSRPIEGALWIKGADQLAEEFKNSNAHNLRGFEKFLHDASVNGRKFVAAIDPHQFAWYRKNQNTLGNGLNTVSIGTNIWSIGLSTHWFGLAHHAAKAVATVAGASG